MESMGFVNELISNPARIQVGLEVSPQSEFLIGFGLTSKSERNA
jgi:hypothetical protein